MSARLEDICLHAQGINVRQRAGEIVNLLNSRDRIMDERQKVRAVSWSWSCILIYSSEYLKQAREVKFQWYLLSNSCTFTLHFV